LKNENKNNLDDFEITHYPSRNCMRNFKRVFFVF